MNFLKKAMDISLNDIKDNFKFSYLEKKYRNHGHPKIYNWNWHEKNFNRIALVNHLIAKTAGWQSDYLEIGCATNSLFDSVAAKNKVGVDPVRGGTHRMTSDEFFRNNTDKFDVIFIDGLHTYQQVRMDALNALQHVKEDGWIAFHDFLPSSWKEHHVPPLQIAWTGDCWKLAVELTEAAGVEFRILEIDRGVGLLKKTKHNYVIPDMSDELIEAEFDVFVDKVNNFSIINFEEAVGFIEKNLD